MKLGQAIRASESAGILIAGIKNNARLAYRLGRIQDKLTAPIKGMQKAYTELLKQFGTQVVDFTSPEPIDGLVATQLPTDEIKTYTYQCEVAKFETLEDVTEITRDRYTFTNEKKELFDAELELLSDEPVEMDITIQLSMFDGVEIEGLGQAIIGLGDIVVDE